MNDEAQVTEDQTESMTERQLDGVSGGSSPMDTLEAELAAMQKMEQAAMQAASAAEQAEMKALQTLMNDLAHMKP